MIQVFMTKKTFRAWPIDQDMLLPPSLSDFVAADHPALFVRDLVREQLDLSSIYATYSTLRGHPPYDPRMMVALLLYGYSRGVYSSRRLARACEERVDFMAVCGLQQPDFRTISEFRRRHLDALSGLFIQVLGLCRRAGLVKLGHVALDGTKIKANASKHKAMSYARMKKAEDQLASEVAAWFDAAQAADAAQDAEFGSDLRGDEMPDWMADKQQRLAKIREAKAALEAEAEAKAAAEAEEKARQGKKPAGGRKPKHSPGTPKDKAQRNFTDPESRIMKGQDGFIQGYNGQAAVDAEHQIIVAQHLTNNSTDQGQLIPLADAIEANLGAKPRELSADTGYCSEANLKALEERCIPAYVATGRWKNQTAALNEETRPRAEAMRKKLRRAGHRSRYRLRKQVVEPVFGQIKQARGFRQFLLRGIEKTSAEWSLICTVHNLMKLEKAIG
jgi:transposase